MSEITLETLRAKGACKNALAEFQRRFGERVTVTEDLAASVAEVFDWNWAARALLSPAGLTEYSRAFDRACAEYERMRDQAWAEYERVCDQARAEHLRVCNRARAEYERVRDQVWAEYERMLARTFARLYVRGGPQR